MTTPLRRSLLVLLVMITASPTLTVDAQEPPSPEDRLTAATCGTAWKIVSDKQSGKLPRSADLHWIALEQLEKKECLKDESKHKKAKEAIEAAELLVQQEIRNKKSGEEILRHLSALCSAQISAKLYDGVPAGYQALLADLNAANLSQQFRTKRHWFEYVEMVVAAAFATGKVDEGLAIAEAELQAGSATPITEQARFAIKIGDLLLSRVRVADALRLYGLGLQLDEKGERAQHALYWQTLDLYRRGELPGAQDTLKKFENVASEPSLKNRVPVLRDIVQAEKSSPIDTSIKDPEYLQVWRDINLVGRQ